MNNRELMYECGVSIVEAWKRVEKNKYGAEMLKPFFIEELLKRNLLKTKEEWDKINTGESEEGEAYNSDLRCEI